MMKHSQSKLFSFMLECGMFSLLSCTRGTAGHCSSSASKARIWVSEIESEQSCDWLTARLYSTSLSINHIADSISYAQIHSLLFPQQQQGVSCKVTHFSLKHPWIFTTLTYSLKGIHHPAGTHCNWHANCWIYQQYPTFLRYCCSMSLFAAQLWKKKKKKNNEKQKHWMSRKEVAWQQGGQAHSDVSEIYSACCSPGAWCSVACCFPGAICSTAIGYLRANSKYAY